MSFNGQMLIQTMAHSCHRISAKKKGGGNQMIDIHINMDAPPGIELNEKCQCQKITYYMIHF